MSLFQPIVPREITDNFIRLIGQDWMLVTAGKQERFNTMTASWGGVGFLWNKPVVFVFVRPQRYTFEFMEANEGFTLSFFPEGYRAALQLCGTVSGREVNKVEKAGLTPRILKSGEIGFEEATLILECRKLYVDRIKATAFREETLSRQWYPEEDFHQMYVAEIVNAWEKR